MKYDVCVFGGCSIDQMFYQNMDGSYNQTPNCIFCGGKGSNQAVAAARAGAKTIIISKIGHDEIGEKIIYNLKENNVDISRIEVAEGITNDYADIFINLKDKDNDIKRYTGAIETFSKDMIRNNLDCILNSNIVVCQLKCPIEVTEELINVCYKNNKTLVLTPCRPEKLKNRQDLIDKISIITCNKTECETIFETSDIESCVKKYPNKLIVTLGSEGLVYYNGERIVKMPAIKCEVLDTVGAGDTLNGNLVASLVNGNGLQHSLRRAMYASSMKIMVKSAQEGMPRKIELDNYIFNHRNKQFKYNKELEVARQLVKDASFIIESNKNLQISSKRDDSLLTNADIEVENYIIKKIKEIFPKDNFLTEENYPDNELKDRTWVIDPIDGTSHFIKNDSFWGIQLAFYDVDSTKFSIIYLPKKKEFYYAAENTGAYLNNHKILKKEANPLNQCIIEFGGSIYKEYNEKKEIFNKLLFNDKLVVANVLHVNSCCVSYTNLASNKTDALVISTKKKWDIMPGICLCKEAGMNFYPLDFDGKITLVTNNENIETLITNKINNAKSR